MSIRLRLTLWYSVVFALGLAAFAVVVWLGTRATLHQNIDGWLMRQADGLEQFLKLETHGTGTAAVVEETREFSSGLPRGSGIRLFDRDGNVLLEKPESGDTRLEVLPASLTRRVHVAGEEFHYALWRSMDESQAALDDLRFVILALIPVFLALSAGGGWFISGRALRPVEALTQAARKISLQDLSVPLPLPPRQDELRPLCEAWNEMLSRLDLSASQLRQFTADASHELRTPVALIRTTAELALRQERSTDHYRASLKRIEEDATELTSLIESLMELTRTDAGRASLILKSVNVEDVVSEVRSKVGPTAAENRIDLAVHLPKEPLVVMADRGALQRLLLVLLDNALKFTPPPGRVELRVASAPKGHEVVVEVEDTGIGISEEDLPKVFDRFYQADRSRSSGGAGLGLSIAQWIVDAHRGRIEVRSSPGQGALFRIFIPAA